MYNTAVICLTQIMDIVAWPGLPTQRFLVVQDVPKVTKQLRFSVSKLSYSEIISLNMQTLKFHIAVMYHLATLADRHT